MWEGRVGEGLQEGCEGVDLGGGRARNPILVMALLPRMRVDPRPWESVDGGVALTGKGACQIRAREGAAA